MTLTGVLIPILELQLKNNQIRESNDPPLFGLYIWHNKN
jgi:hypothetical protein